MFRALHPRSWGYNLQVQAIMSLRGDDWEVPSDDPADIEIPQQLPKPADIRARLKAIDSEIASRASA